MTGYPIQGLGAISLVADTTPQLGGDLDLNGHVINQMPPSGTITMFGGAVAPTGYLLCDGTAYSRSTYSTLFGVLGETYGVGDGSTTFNVPDMRGVYPKGAGTTDRAAGKDANGNYYAATLGAYVTDKMQGHKHPIPAAAVTTGGGIYGFNGGSYDWGTGSGADAVAILSIGGLPSTDGTNGTPRTGMTTEPQNLGITFIIKT